VAALWDRCFETTKGGQTVEWLFRDGPAGPCARTVAEVDGRIVAHAGVANVRFRLGTEEVLGGYSVGAMTDPEARGRRLFYRLGCALYERMEGEGFAFVAGFSNSQSHRLMTGPLQRTAIRPFPWCVKILRPLGAVMAQLRIREARPPEATPVKTRVADVEIEPCTVDDARLDKLWSRCAPGVRMGAVRDAAFANWRFATRPDANYRSLLAIRGGAPLAWVVYRCLGMRELRVGFVVDLLVSPDEVEAGRALLGSVRALAKREGAELLTVLLPGEGAAREALRRCGFWRIPERFHPQIIRHSVRGLGRWANRSELLDPHGWQLAWSDTDVV
jgi:hypothetical protein